MEELKQHTEVKEKEAVKKNDYTNGALVMIGTVVVIVLLKYLSKLAQRQKSTSN